MELLSQERLGKFSTKKMREVIPSLVDNITTSYFNLGGMILRIRNEGIFLMWGKVEYATFEAWCEDILKFGLRKAQYLSAIYQGIIDINPTIVLRDRLLKLGWVKVGQILRVASSKKSLMKWVTIAEELTLRQLQDKVRWELGKDKAASELEADDKEFEKTITRRIEMSEKQNIHFDKAVDIIKRRLPQASMGDVLGVLAINYMATNVRDDEGGIAVELENIITGLEDAFGVTLVVNNKKASTSKTKKKKAKAS